jgi:hypothetical protein
MTDLASCVSFTEAERPLLETVSVPEDGSVAEAAAAVTVSEASPVPELAESEKPDPETLAVQALFADIRTVWEPPSWGKARLSGLTDR